MARNFVRASSQSLGNTSAVPATAAPLTIACWGSGDTSSCPAVVLSNGGSHNFGLFWSGNLSRTIRCQTQAGAAAVGAGVGTYTAGAWHHGAAVFASSTSRTPYLDGAAGSPNTSSAAPTGIDRIHIGQTGSGSAFAQSNFAEVGVWSIALAADDIAALADGVCPLLVRPESLVFYAPLIGRDSPEIDVVGGIALTLNNTPTAADHPRVFRPRGRVSVFVPAAGGGGGGNRRRRVILCGGR